MTPKELKALLNEAADTYNQVGFIADDPVSVVHRFSKRQDREIAGLFAATLAWGTRKSVLNSCEKLMTIMENSPHEFIMAYNPENPPLHSPFVHRTFQQTDLNYFWRFLNHWYRSNESLESLFSCQGQANVAQGLKRFHRTFFSLANAPARTQKHVATPERKSACKRLNMFLRWMVRSDEKGVDLGIWKSISASQLICPLDVHSGRVARKLGILKRKQNDWQAALELTGALSAVDHTDPVKYDYALFGLGVAGVL